METPILDFVRQYAESDPLRLHMPGHKGVTLTGGEALDITEVEGADSLYEASGIIRRSEENASSLFGCPTFYSTEGSSQCIRAMLFLALQRWKGKGRPAVLAGRNAHRTFLSACALLDLDVTWIYGETASYLSCVIDGNTVSQMLSAGERPVAVYLTSPDYLGNTLDIASIAEVCHRNGVPLLVDNAHGAYLRFLRPSRHPADLGADLCCDSAHKTLPVLTGGAYLHAGSSLFSPDAHAVKNALALFGSTSPSYLILQSLDGVNAYLAGGYSERLETFAEAVELLKGRLSAQGFSLLGNEPLKITIRPKSYGYTGIELSAFLKERSIVSEFCDQDHLVLMLTPEIGANGLTRLEEALLELPRHQAIIQLPPVFHAQQQVLSIREAMLSESETIPVESCLGRVLAAASVGCPPAVPIVICGERIDEHALNCFRYYGVSTCTVVKRY